MTAASAKVGAPPSPRAPGPAAERMLRNIYLSCGVGGLIFAALLLPNAVEQLDHLEPAYGITLIVIGLAAPISLAVLAPWAPIHLMRSWTAFIVITFGILHLVFPLFLIDGLGSLPHAPWVQGINALHAVMATVVWQSGWVWGYGIAQAPVVMLTQIAARPDSASLAFQDAIGGTLYGLILMGMSLAVVRAATKADIAAAIARDNAAEQARETTREREESRINAIVHDDVMSVLYAAARPSPPEGLTARAEEALEEIARLAEDTTPARDYAPEQLVAMLRSTALDQSHDVDFSGTWEPGDPIPATVGVSISEALGEALRNSLRHAGSSPAISRRVRVEASPASVTVTCSDDGEGFDRRKVSTRRLGIRVSIVDRMRALEGGDADIASTVGSGTTVVLSWRRP